METANEFFNQYGGYTREEALERSIEFAKMHVKQALEKASLVRYDKEPFKKKFLNCYPLDNVK